jgi:hypothetical protein
MTRNATAAEALADKLRKERRDGEDRPELFTTDYLMDRNSNAEQPEIARESEAGKRTNSLILEH